MMSSTRKLSVLVLVLILIVPMVLLQHKIDPERHQFEPLITNVSQGAQQLPIEFALGAVLGFREAIAGLLWVRTDEFFDDGDYDAIVPMVRIITWLDPHNLDVYETGAWHMDYNFTDSRQLSDRRYIPFAIALMKEGIQNNPYNTDLYSELAFTHYFRKIEDYPSAAEWYLKAENQRFFDPQTRKYYPVPWDPTTVGHGLAHAYEAMGDYKDAIAAWQLSIKVHKQLSAAQNTMAHADSLDVAETNLKETIARVKWRKTQTSPPWNVHFQAKLVRIAPMVFMMQGNADMEGATKFNLDTGAHTWGPVNGCRVEIRLQDADYQMPKESAFTLNFALPKEVSIMQDAASIQNGKFKHKIDMSKDHTGDQAMYPFAAPKYTVTLWINPADPIDTPPNVADRFGWLGEGMTDDKYLYTGGIIPGTGGAHVPGLRMIEEQFDLTRQDIMGSGIQTFTGHPVVVGTP